LTESHWTAEAFFVISLVTGVLSVFFSCAISPAFYGLHSADDIKDFLTKPTTSANKRRLNKFLSTAEDLKNPSEQSLQDLKLLIFQDRWKVASCFSAIMLVAPMNLLKVSLNAFLIGLGIYFGKVYTANLIPAFGSGSLGLLIIFIVITLLGIAVFYIPEGLKSVEASPMERFRELLHAARLRMAHGGEPTTEGRASQDGKPTPQSESNSVRQSTHVRTGSKISFEVKEYQASDASPKPASGKLPQASEPSPPDEAGLLSKAGAPPFPRTSSLCPGLSDILEASKTPKSNSVQSALADLIRVQEDSVQASRRLLEAYEKFARVVEGMNVFHQDVSGQVDSAGRFPPQVDSAIETGMT
jgi:hypothetical protein